MNQMQVFVLLTFLAVLGVIVSSGCIQQTPSEKGSATQGEVEKSQIDWMEIELNDVATGDKFKISGFKGKPVLMESFAVWCPTCTGQQKEIVKLRKREEDEGIIHISLDTDPNEDESRVREHLNTYGFDWYYAIAPIELTQALIDEFGLGVVNAPAVPMILICEDQSTRFLRRGIKPADELLSEVEKGC